MTAQVFFITASAEGVPTVPMTALVPKDGGAGLYVAQVVRDGHVETQEIRIGLHTRFTAQVLSGLRLGERVVTGRRTGGRRPSLIGFRW